MKRKSSAIIVLLFAVIYLSGCGTLMQETDDQSMKEKEVFTFEDAKSDSSAPIPADSLSSSDFEISVSKTRKKSLDNQETPAVIKTAPVKDSVVAAKADSITVPPVSKAEPVKDGITIQIGAFRFVDNANELVRKFKTKMNMEIFINYNERTGLHLVRVGPMETITQAREMLKELRRKGFKEMFIVK
ncbi:MAG: SPOR domain-containing protein [Ignavibacteria bacterium]